MNNPLVSIITPTYNHSIFIGECIQSVLNQTYANWEMLIVNDGSTDDTTEVVQGYAERDKRIRLFEQKNIGILRLAETYNFSLSKTKGKYVAILEGDDLWLADKLTNQVRVLENNTKLVAAWSTAYHVNADHSSMWSPFPELKEPDKNFYFNMPIGKILNILFLRNCIPALTMFIKKEALQSIGGFSQGYGLPLVDIPTWQKLSTKGPFHFDERPLGKYRVHPAQTTKAYTLKITQGFYKLSLNNYRAFSKDKSLEFDVNEILIKKYFNTAMLMAFSNSGWHKLSKNYFNEAKTDFVKSIFHPGESLEWRLRSILGIILSFLNLNFKWLSRLFCRPNYKVQKRLAFSRRAAPSHASRYPGKNI